MSSNLSWSHYLELLKIDDKNKRGFYLNEAINSNWSVRELQRQKNSLLYERLIVSKDKNKIIELSQKGQVLKSGKDLIKDPFVLEFLDIKNNKFLEKDLESNLINHISEFLLELGRGFSFISRQKKIDVDGDNFYIDLVFYNYVLKCFVLLIQNSIN